MKHMLRRSFLLLAMVMSFALAVTASAVGTDEIGVQLNGQMLAFSDAAPMIQNGRTMIPMRAVFEALGAEVSYDDASRTVTATREGVTVIMVIGQNTVQVQEGSESHSFTMDVAPSVDPVSGRTYVPVRFAAEALGCNVGWDAGERTVLIVDVDAVVAQAGPFTLMDRAMRMEKAAAPEGNQALDGSFHANIAITDPNLGNLSMPMSGTFTALGNASAVEMDMKMSMDLSGMQEAAGMDEALAAMLKDMQFGMIMDVETGVYYLRPGTLADLLLGVNLQSTNGTEGTILSGLNGAWFKLDVNALMEQMSEMMAQAGMDLSELTSGEAIQDISVADMLAMILSQIPLTDKDEDWASIQMMMDMFSALLSDNAFVKEGDNYVCNYALTAPVQGQSVSVSYKLTLAMTGEDVTGIALTAHVEQGSDKISIDVSGDSKTAHVDMSINSEGVSMSVKVDSTETAINLDMNIDAEETVSMDYHLEGTVTSTGEAPATQPPADAQIFDLNELLFGAMPIAA